jgi:site-specific recombinase XerD
MRGIVRRKQQRKLPGVLSGGEVEQLLTAARKPVHRALFMLAYGAGLRASEACALQVEDIDSARMVIRVRNAKRNKERETILGRRLLAELRDYWRQTRPPRPYLFPGTGGAGPTMTRQAFYKALYRTAEGVGLRQRVGPHVLRHCFATTLLEDGVDLRTVQILLGHASISSTTRYLHLTEARRRAVRCPLDCRVQRPKSRLER